MKDEGRSRQSATTAMTAHNPFDAKTDCIHCGFCLPVCPTYDELGTEADSPRGRIYMMQAVKEGILERTETYVHHIDLCLGCRTCESACPSGVEFSALLDVARADIAENFKHPAWQTFLKRLILGKIFPYPARLHAVFFLLRLYQILGLQWLIRKTKLLKVFPGNMHALEKLLPKVPSFSDRIKTGALLAPHGEKKYRVAFIVGCVMNELMPDVHQASLRVLRENGCEVVIPEGQICCGALQNHAGERATAQEMARKNIAAFEKYEYDYIIINAAGCGALLKEYPRLLSDDVQYRERALNFSERVKDISEFLVQMGPLKPLGRLERRVAYDDPCHLLHGQKIGTAPRRLLEQIPGLELVLLKGAEQCCGSAGIYNITQHEMSMRLLEKKIQNIKESKAQIVATGNPGCMMQIAYGARKMGVRVRVVHPVQLLDRAYQSDKEPAGGRMIAPRAQSSAAHCDAPEGR